MLTPKVCLLAIVLIGVAACSKPPEKLRAVTAGHLACFTIAPTATGSTCDELCAEAESVCTGIHSISVNPPLTCSDSISTSGEACRCCHLAQ